ncbi:hypothetical protein CQW23_33731 [Capsicum baccatum]|uniref:Protein TAR1 n=1 Tax=Capsicum baccatum TaxID=33114 RepID=A0A2G2V117_CAPBA|nr:hypothetical protein CQW23_33731 [Capsicum baccatum]
MAAPPGLGPKVLKRPPCPPTHRGLAFAPTTGYERFARQYRCGPPPEFPLASPRSGIVHYLSGPDSYAHTQTLLRRSRFVGGAPLGGIPPIIFVAPYGYTRPLTRTHVRLLGQCLKMGRMGSPQASVRSAQMPKHARGAHCLPQLRRRRSTSIPKARALAAPLIHAGPRPESIGGPAHRRSTSFSGRIAGPHPLSSRQFQALFDSLLKALFIFPSRYLFAIGLSPVFSLGRNSLPDLGCIPKQPDS